jgi:hypothetical protein
MYQTTSCIRIIDLCDVEHSEIEELVGFDKAVHLADCISKCTKLFYTRGLPLKQSADTTFLWMLSIII